MLLRLLSSDSDSLILPHFPHRGAKSPIVLFNVYVEVFRKISPANYC